MYLLVSVFLVACIKFAIWCVRVCIAGALWIVGTVVDCIGRGVSRRKRNRIVAARYEIEQAKQIDRQRREKMRFEWQQEKMEWARQKEADRRQDLEWKRKQREQIEKERKEKKGADKTEQARRIAKVDLDFIDQSLTDLTPLVDQYRETFENTVTDKTKWNAYKKLYQLEARQNRLDKQRMKALYTIQGGA